MTIKVEAVDIQYEVLGFDSSIGKIVVMFTNPYSVSSTNMHQDMKRLINPVIETDGNDQPYFDQAKTNDRILNHRSNVAEKMWIEKKKEIEASTSVGTDLTQFFGEVVFEDED